MDKIDDSEYSTVDFLYRLNMTQEVIRSAGLDATLIINGTDGLDNAESAKMINWLFKGNNGPAIYTDFYADKLFEESFVLITQTGWSLFGSDALFKAYFKELASIPARELSIYKEEDAESDKDAFERHKIKEFYRIVESHGSIGMFVEASEPKAFKRSIEEIPLVQSYGLDGDVIRRWR